MKSTTAILKENLTTESEKNEDIKPIYQEIEEQITPFYEKPSLTNAPLLPYRVLQRSREFYVKHDDTTTPFNTPKVTPEATPCSTPSPTPFSTPETIPMRLTLHCPPIHLDSDKEFQINKMKFEHALEERRIEEYKQSEEPIKEVKSSCLTF